VPFEVPVEIVAAIVLAVVVALAAFWAWEHWRRDKGDR